VKNATRGHNIITVYRTGENQEKLTFSRDGAGDEEEPLPKNYSAA
jgi:hypothetical protein